MKKYNASFTVEASVVVSLVSICIVAVMMVALYACDCLTVKNTLLINSIKKQEEYYFFSNDSTRFLSENRKINSGLIRYFNTSTLDYEHLIEDKLFITDITYTEQDKKIGLIYTRADLKCLLQENVDASVTGGVPTRNNSDILRIISVLAKGGI